MNRQTSLTKKWKYSSFGMSSEDVSKQDLLVFFRVCGDGETIHKALVYILDSNLVGSWRAKVIGFGTDGAAVLMGEKGRRCKNEE